MEQFYTPSPYYKGELTYVQVPRLLFNPPFEGLSNEARILHGMLLKRVEQSYDDPERWSDNGEVFVYFHNAEVTQKLYVGKNKATDTFKELEAADLIRRERQKDVTKPNKIYLNEYWEEETPIEAHATGRRRPMTGPKRRITDYIKVYWALFYKPYDELSNTARIVYGVLKAQEGFEEYKGELKTDKEGAYIYYKVDKIMQKLHISKETAIKALNELENAGLIQRKRQGFGKPAKIRIKLPIVPMMEQSPNGQPAKQDEPRRTRRTRRTYPEKPTYGRTCPEKPTYACPEKPTYACPEKPTSTIYIYNSKRYSVSHLQAGTEVGATNQTPPVNETRLICTEEAKEQVSRQIDWNALCDQYPDKREYLHSIEATLVDELSSDAARATIGGATRTRAEIRARLDEVNTEDVAEILDKLKGTRVNNMRGYLLTCLYNAPASRGHRVDKDEYEDQIAYYAQMLKRKRERKKAEEEAEKAQEAG